jgi:hypothetical protein
VKLSDAVSEKGKEIENAASAVVAKDEERT